MIRVIQSQKPLILEQLGQDWLSALQYAVSKTEKKQAAKKYRHRQIRSASDNLFHGKCAYCESKIKHISYPHIEHYRPQAKFPNLTFDWDNLLLACGICNSFKYKGDRFPEVSEGGPYINPCIDNPEDHFQFVYDPKAKLASVYGNTNRGDLTEKELGLNRPDLRTHRSSQMIRLAFIASRAEIDPVAKQLLEEAKNADSEYSAFARKL